MKFSLITSALALVCSGAIQASPLPDFPFINVTGVAKLEVAPDEARLQLVIRHTAATADAATNAVYQQSRQLLQFLQTQGLSEADIEAAQLNKSALYKDYNDRTITGYEASQPVMLTLKQLTNYAAIMDYLFKQPQIFNIQASFDSSKREQHELKLSQLAGENARQRAQQLAAGKLIWEEKSCINCHTILGEGAFFAHRARHATVQAAAPGRLWCLTAMRFAELSNRQPGVALALVMAAGQVLARRAVDSRATPIWRSRLP